MTTLTDKFEDFGERERIIVRDLLDAWNTQGLPDDFYTDGVKPMLNKNSGYVFLTNSDFQVAMLNGDKLESFYNCPCCGHEGFLDEMAHGEDDNECRQYCRDIGVEPDEFDCDACGNNCDDVNTVEDGNTFVCNTCLDMYCESCTQHEEKCTCEPEQVDWKRIDDKQRI